MLIIDKVFREDSVKGSRNVVSSHRSFPGISVSRMFRR